MIVGLWDFFEKNFRCDESVSGRVKGGGSQGRRERWE